jgi:hypothetical protein
LIILSFAIRCSSDMLPTTNPIWTGQGVTRVSRRGIDDKPPLSL